MKTFATVIPYNIHAEHVIAWIPRDGMVIPSVTAMRIFPRVTMARDGSRLTPASWFEPNTDAFGIASACTCDECTRGCEIAYRVRFRRNIGWRRTRYGLVKPYRRTRAIRVVGDNGTITVRADADADAKWSAMGFRNG